MPLIRVNEAARSFSRGRVQGYSAGFIAGISVATKILQSLRDGTGSRARKDVLTEALEAVNLAIESKEGQSDG